MPSFFRPASEITTSDESSSSSHAKGETETQEPGDADETLTTVQSVGSEVVADQGSVVPSAPVVGNDQSHQRELILHTLLEDKCLTDAVDHLNKRPNNSIYHTKSHPDVKALASCKYQYISKHLSDHGLVEDGLQSEELQSVRQGVRLGLEHLSLKSTLESNKGGSSDLENTRRLFRTNSAAISTLPKAFQKLLVPAGKAATVSPTRDRRSKAPLGVAHSSVPR